MMSSAIAEYNFGLEENSSETDDLESAPIAYEVITYPADFTLEGLVSKYKRKTLVIPGFQRSYVWNIKQASRLIESFLLGLPVPSIFLFTDDQNNEQLVIDGQQRLMSIYYFMEGYFGEPNTQGRRTVFKLSGLNEKSPYHNKTYKDLEETDLAAFNKLNDSVLRAFIIKQVTPYGNTSIYHIFERLNTGGTQLVGQEIRNCVYHGNFNDLLYDLNQYPNWRRIFGLASPHKRQKDIELILRFFSLYENLDHYSRPIKDFMSNYMGENQHMDQQKIDMLSKLFKNTVDLVLNCLGEKPFHIWSGFNIAAFDAVFTITARHQLDHIDIEKYNKMIRDSEFVRGVRGPTADETVIDLRMKKVAEYLVP